MGTPNPENFHCHPRSYSPAGVLVTETGIPSALPSTHVRIYFDKTNHHDSGLAIGNILSLPNDITVKAGLVPESQLVADIILNS